MSEVQRVHVGPPPDHDVIECIELDIVPDDIRELLEQPGVVAVSIRYTSDESLTYYNGGCTCGQ